MFVPCIPFDTDAPKQHWPIGTLLLIVANVVLFFRGPGAELVAGGNAADQWAFSLGAINPLVWLTANLMHGDWLRLILNLLFLWTLGLMVEGKLGVWRFVPLYAALAAGYVAALNHVAWRWPQYVTPTMRELNLLGSTPIIYALAGMAVVWLPANSVRCAAWIWVKGYVYELPVLVTPLVFAACDVALVWRTHGDVTLALPPLVGLPVGMVVATLLLVTRIVDGDGWDVFHVLSGSAGDVDLDEMRRYRRPDDFGGGEQLRQDRDTPPGDQAADPEPVDATPADDAAKVAAGLAALRENLARGDVAQAVALMQRMAAVPGWELPQEDLQRWIALLRTKNLPTPLAEGLAEYVRRFPDDAAYRLEYASHLLHNQHRPSRALEELSQLANAPLTAEQQADREALQSAAQQRLAEGTFEIDDTP